MIESVKQYILSIICTALIVSILMRLLNKKTTHYALIRMACGLFLLLTIIKPWTDIRIDDYTSYFSTVQKDAERQADIGRDTASDSIYQIIKEQTEAYILEKALSLDVKLEASVTLSKDDRYLPVSVKLKGDVSPYAKKQLIKIINNDLGIPEGKQTWT